MPSPARVTLQLRAAQILCGIITFACCIAEVSEGHYYNDALIICTLWGSLIAVVITILILIFFRRPLENWRLAVTLDALAVASLTIAFGCICGNGATIRFDPEVIVGVLATFTGAGAHSATTARTILLYRRHVNRTKSDDPLKPYLMKKEIDVWCYPVQNEQGQLFMDYEPVSSTSASKAPSTHSTRARSVKSFVRVDDEPSHTAGRPQSSIQTTAGWSVPSQNETLQRSEHAPSTALPSYRSPGTTLRTGAMA